MGGGTTYTYIDLPTIHCKTSLSAITSPSSSLNFPVSANNNYTTAQSICCKSNDSETCTRSSSSVLGKQENRRVSGSYWYEEIFRLVPSKLEVETAIASLQKFLQGVFSSGSNRLLQQMDGRVKEAFYLLQKDTIIKRLVVSLATDKALWDAVMNNQMVRQLRDSFICPAAESRIQSCDELDLVSAAENCRIQSCDEPDLVICLMSWIMDITVSKVTELIQKFQLLMNDIFQSREKENLTEDNRDEVDDRVQSSLFLSIVIFLIVVLARFQI